jgi:hypothetical protein
MLKGGRVKLLLRMVTNQSTSSVGGSGKGMTEEEEETKKWESK